MASSATGPDWAQPETGTLTCLNPSWGPPAVSINCCFKGSFIPLSIGHTAVYHQISKWGLWGLRSEKCLTLFYWSCPQWGCGQCRRSVHIQSGHLSFPTLLSAPPLIGTPTLSGKSKERRWCLRCWLDIRPMDNIVMCFHMCLAEILVIELISVSARDLQLNTEISCMQKNSWDIEWV